LRIVLLMIEDKALQAEIRDLIPHRYFLIESDDDTFDWIYSSDLNRGVVLLDIDGKGASDWLQESRVKKPELICVGLGKDKKQALLMADYLYDYLPLPCEPWQLEKTLDRAWDKAIESFGEALEKASSASVRNSVSRQDFESATRPWARVIRDFSRTISNQFDREKFLNLFIYAVKELMPVGKLVVLLKDNDSGDYLVAAQQGLNPDIIQKLRLRESDGIIAWLSEEGQILQRSAILSSIPAERKAEIILEMKLLHALVCVPLMAHGKLNGVLCLGSKVAGTLFHEKELELLYSVCGNIAIALNDISLHEQLVNQKIYIESILQRMNSGVIAIDRAEIITTFNQRAGEILNREPNSLLNRDLRSLLSPLGDMLYETMLNGYEYHKKYIEMAVTRTPLEISTYRMVSQLDEVLGSVMIIDDITARKKAEAERSKTEQITVLNRFVSQLTHEIKNPMVAIQTYAQLLPEKYEDSEFRNTFSQTVKQEVKRLNELIDQLIAFSTPLNYHYEVKDIHEVIDQAVSLLNEQGVELNGLIRRKYCGEKPQVKVDRLSMARAFSYLINFLNEGARNNGKEIIILTVLAAEESDPEQIHIMITNCCTRVDFDDPEKIFNPLEICPESAISIGLPVSKKIIEDHGGTLHAVQTGKDALKFGISLPLFRS
jgi:PAS domain S-box-containing protein